MMFSLDGEIVDASADCWPLARASVDYVVVISFLDLNHVDSSMRVHSGRLPGYVSDRSVATLARYPTSFCKILYVWFYLNLLYFKKGLVWTLCSCRCKRAPHVVFFVPV